ncbi:nSTAND1 domain-containing NTPase [Aquabacterium sp. OR-4]|uniref:nSTAND1 domain-containing NTPase n=1 Tax=Aquabacterium sp. OR-4 TaxID=2978127 RepID=UPI0021B2CB52|nr:AAA family ATPase [Aquabacterium sp. OR-4]MDT7835696.1 AAA family ATPase [Aquabacterium sp. OR-4]
MAGEHALALIAANPFPGLRAFKPGESDRFFGRGQQIAELATHLDALPFLAVSGASGCGKSSLVLAGLLAELRERHADGHGADWRPVVMRPGNRPIERLAEALAHVLHDDEDEDLDHTLGDLAEQRLARSGALFGQLRLGGQGLVEAVRQSRLARRSPAARVLLVVDQFEEVFRFKRMSDPDESAAFVKLLLAAAHDPASPVSVVITLRSDALGNCAEFHDLPEAVSRGGYLVPRLKREQRKEAIVRPIEWRGARIAPRLVQRLLNDVSDDFDDLPVMQHVLSRTWQRWAEACAGSRPLDLEDYDAVGTAAQALENHAEEARTSLGPLGAPGGTVERVFRALTERVGDGTEVRRPLPYAQLLAIAGDGSEAGQAAVREVVERYRRADTAFLLPGAEISLDDAPVIDISHESLIRLWKQLRAWVAAEAEAATELERLLAATRRRSDGQGEPLRGADLARTREWLAAQRPSAGWVQLVAGGDGAAQRDALQAFVDDSNSAEHKALRRHRLQRLSWQAVMVLGVLGVFAFAFYSAREQRLARARELTNQALLELPRDPAASAHLALAALSGDDGNRRADYALRQAMTALAVARPEAIVPLGEALADARFSAGQRWLLAAGGRTVWLLDPATLAVKHTLSAPAPVSQAWVLGQGAAERVLVYTQDWRVHLLPLPSGAAAEPQSLACPGTHGTARAVAVDDGATPQLALGCSDGSLLLASLADGRLGEAQTLLPTSPQQHTVTALAFAADGDWLAAGDNTGQVRAWKRGLAARAWIGQGSAGASALRHDTAVRDLAFHPDTPSLLASAGDDRSARVWRLDLERGLLAEGGKADDGSVVKPMEQLSHDRPVLRVRWVRRSDDQHKLMTVSDKRVIFWTNATTSDQRRHDDWVMDADVSADGELLVSASADGTARVWSTRSVTPMAVLRGHSNEVRRAFFGPGGQVFTVSADHTLRRWRIAAPAVLDAAGHWQESVAFNPRGDRALICGEARHEAGAKARPGNAPARQCRIAPLADLGRRDQADDERLEAAPADTVSAGSWRHDGSQVLALADTHDIYARRRPVLWDAATRRRITPDWLQRWTTAAFNPLRPELVTSRRGGADAPEGELAVWAVAALAEAEPTPLLRLRGPTGHLAPAISADGRWLATADDNDVLLWDRQAAQAPPLRLRGHAGTVRSLAFSADSQALLSASGDRTARVWPLKAVGAGALPPAVLLSGGHSAAVMSAVFSPDGRFVATGGADNSVRVWDARQGWEISALHRHGDAVPALAWHPDGRIASASDDGTVLLGPCQPCVAPLDKLLEDARLVPQSPVAAASAALPRPASR